MSKPYRSWLSILMCLVPLAASAQSTSPSPKAQGGGSFLVQCPNTTLFHPNPFPSGAPEPAYTGPTLLTASANGVKLDGSVAGQSAPYISNGGQIKCQQISGGDGYMTEADGNQTFMFAFGPLSGLDNIKHGQPGTLLNTVGRATFANSSIVITWI